MGNRKLTLSTRIPFSTSDFFYLNRGATDLSTGQVYAHQSIAFPAWDIHAYLAVSDKALETLLTRGVPAIPDFPALTHLDEPREAFRLEAWNAVKIAIPWEVIELRSATETDPLSLAQTPRTANASLEQMTAFLGIEVL